MADKGRAESPGIPGIPGRYATGKKHPRMGSLARAGDFKRDRNTQVMAGLRKGQGVLFPFGLIEIRCQKVAGING
jgi:hypothetical protein